MIELRNVQKYYDSAAGAVHALQHFDRPSSGLVSGEGQALNQLNENELALWRGRHVGIVFQFYQLLPTLSAIDNVLFAMSLVNKVPKRERQKLAAEYLTEVGLGEK